MIKIKSFSINQSGYGTKVSFAIHGTLELSSIRVRFTLNKTHKTPVCIHIREAIVMPESGVDEDTLKKYAALEVKKDLTKWAETSQIIPEALRPEILRLFTIKNPADKEIVK